MGTLLDKLEQDMFSLQDEEYIDFCEKIIPTMPRSRIIGIRIPLLRGLAKRYLKEETDIVELFIETLPHKYYEEETLHMFFLEASKDAKEVLKRLDEFLPTVTNWASADARSPKVLKRYPVFTLGYIEKWLKAKEVYTVRYAIKLLMDNFLGTEYQERYLAEVAAVEHRDYYVQMIVAWYFAEAFLTHREDVLIYFIDMKLPAKTHNEAIQKAIDSYRVSEKDKEYLKSMRRPGGRLRR